MSLAKEKHPKALNQSNKTIKRYILQLVILIIALITTIIGFVIDLQGGWTGEKTIVYAFSIAFFFCGISTYYPLYEYLITNDKLAIKANNKLFRCLEQAEKDGFLLSFGDYYNNREKECFLEKINKQLLASNPSFVSLTHDSITSFFDNKDYLKKSFSFDADSLAELFVSYYEYNDAYSEGFEDLYARYKTKEMLARKQFPVFNTLVPLILGIVGLFSTIYQSVSNLEQSIKTSLVTYIVVLIEVAFIGGLLTLFGFKKNIKAVIKENEMIIDDYAVFCELHKIGKGKEIDKTNAKKSRKANKNK